MYIINWHKKYCTYKFTAEKENTIFTDIKNNPDAFERHRTHPVYLFYI